MPIHLENHNLTKDNRSIGGFQYYLIQRETESTIQHYNKKHHQF